MQLLNLSSFQIDKGQFKRFSSDFERHRAEVEWGAAAGHVTSPAEISSGREAAQSWRMRQRSL